MKKINCMIADDEALARDVIKNHISKLERLNLVAECTNGAEVYTALKNNPVDLFFLDIKMPHVTGIELLQSLNDLPPTILTTAYREFALDGYELNVIDYLLKPISLQRFLKAIDKYELWMNPKHITNSDLNQLEKSNKANDFIYVKSDKKMIKIMIKDILFIEGLKDYVRINAVDKSVITYQTVTYFEEKLPADQFMRIHRSYIISLNHINSFSATEIEIRKQCLPIGSSYAKQVAKKLITNSL